jgi:hypothetical protein
MATVRGMSWYHMSHGSARQEVASPGAARYGGTRGGTGRRPRFRPFQ